VKIRKGDRVQVLTGKDRGRQGVVLRAMPAEDKVIVEGVNIHKHHDKPRQAGQPGGIRHQEAPIHVSNVALVVDGKPTRVGYRVTTEGEKFRISRRTGGDV
jgi:large subunit ribosomal protein L24